VDRRAAESTEENQNLHDLETAGLPEEYRIVLISWLGRFSVGWVRDGTPPADLDAFYLAHRRCGGLEAELFHREPPVLVGGAL
jgi:hypothetical protein